MPFSIERHYKLLLPKIHQRNRFLYRCFSEEQQEKTSTVISENKRGIKVALIGCPNTGKSSITNVLVRANICAVSKRIDTTRANTTTSLTENLSNLPTLPKVQLVVVDSPGIVGLTHAKDIIGTHSDANILVDPERAIKHADHVLVVQDVTMPGQYLHHRLLHLLHRYAHIPASLVLNKVDLIERRTDLLQLAEILTEGFIDGIPIPKEKTRMGRLDTQIVPKSKKDSLTAGIRIHPTSKDKMDEEWHKTYNNLLQKPTHKCSWTDTRKLFMGQVGWPDFKSVFFISCKRGDGVDGLREYLKNLSNPTTWYYPEDSVTTKKSEQTVVEHIRSEFLDSLPAYIAYELQPVMVEFEQQINDDGTKCIRILVDVVCEKEKWAQLTMRFVNAMERRLTKKFHELFHAQILMRLQIKHKNILLGREDE